MLDKILKEYEIIYCEKFPYLHDCNFEVGDIVYDEITEEIQTIYKIENGKYYLAENSICSDRDAWEMIKLKKKEL